jgi:Tol biopolymer transport system component
LDKEILDEKPYKGLRVIEEPFRVLLRKPVFNIDIDCAKYNKHMPKRQIILMVGLIALFFGLGVGIWLLIPRAIKIIPADKTSDILPSATIHVKFNQPIVFQQNKDYFVIDPPTPGKYSYENGNLTFTPSINYPAGTVVNVQLSPEIKSTLGLKLLSRPSWSFQVRHAWLLYLLDTDTRTELYKIDPNGFVTSKLIDIPESITDYNVGFDGRTVLYTSKKNHDTNINWFDITTGKTTLVYTCISLECSEPELSKDQKYLSYVSGSSPQHINPLTAKVWLLTLSGQKAIGQPIPASGNTNFTREPSWSDNGWLVYFDNLEQMNGFYNPSTGLRKQFPNDTGEIGGWSPDGQDYLVPQIVYPAVGSTTTAQYSSRLVAFYPETGQQKEITRNDTVEDVLPEYSPDGKLIAFARRYVIAQYWTPGRQLWFVRSDGNNARPMTNSEDNNHLDFAWSPDGGTIAYLRFNTASLDQARELWVMDTKTGQAQKILIGAYRLEWLP